MSEHHTKNLVPKFTCIQLLKSQQGSFIIMLCLTFTYFIVELAIGYKTNSMALVADSFHMLSDLLSLVIGFISLVISQKKSKSQWLPYGWSRIEVIGALANCVFLLSLCLSIVYEAIQRIISHTKIVEPKKILIVGCIGLMINIFGVLMFQSHVGCVPCKRSKKKSLKIGQVEESQQLLYSDNESSKNETLDSPVEKRKISHSNHSVMSSENTHTHKHSHFFAHDHAHNHGQMNIMGVLLHLMGDLIGSLVVITSTVIFIFYSNQPWVTYLDPIMSLILVSIILWTTIPLLRSSARVLMLGTPSHINIDSLTNKLVNTYPCIKEIPLFHVFNLNSDIIFCTISIVFPLVSDYKNHVNDIISLLKSKGIHNVTVHPVFECDFTNNNHMNSL